jgi:leucyl/phenylalanyl-tRNA--protein transferase
MTRITPDLVLQAYRMGVFPMAEARNAPEIKWYEAGLRGVLPLDKLHVPRRLVRRIRQQPYRITFDADFEGVIRGCADTRRDTWINDEIIDLYTALHRQGAAHSIEAWHGDTLAGGVYGISIGAAFFGESMFSVRTDASKIALVHLCARLKARGYLLFDTQFVNEHLKQFGVEEIKREEYLGRLAAALAKEASFGAQSSCDQSSVVGASSAPSKDPGRASSAGTPAGRGVSAVAGFAPGTGFLSSGAAAGLASTTGISPATGSLATEAALSGACEGAVSDENVSCDLAEVEAFLHSITQTS